MSDVNETLQELLDRRLREMGGQHEPRTLRAAYMALPKGGDWVTYEVVRRATKGHTRITDRAARTLATMLAVGEDEVRRAAGQRPRLGPFELPPRADRLSESERGVVLSVVDAILSAAEGSSRPSTQSDSAPARHAGESPAEDELAARRRDDTPEAALQWASHPKKGRESEGRQLRRQLDEVGEENQDPGE